jgi:hypothetical protein
MNDVKRMWKRAGKPVPLKKWARAQLKNENDDAAYLACRSWLKNKGSKA